MRTLITLFRKPHTDLLTQVSTQSTAQLPGSHSCSVPKKGKPLTLTSDVASKGEGQGGPRSGQCEGDREQETVPKSEVFRELTKKFTVLREKEAPPFL